MSSKNLNVTVNSIIISKMTKIIMFGILELSILAPIGYILMKLLDYVAFFDGLPKFYYLGACLASILFLTISAVAFLLFWKCLNSEIVAQSLAMLDIKEKLELKNFLENRVVEMVTVETLIEFKEWQHEQEIERATKKIVEHQKSSLE
ncbi:hypothetical protein [Janthinobacterium sp. NKUCC06_STL]|uniref:hypothetical protein n=1 Tax=Janthinobacterium sp. NKUCC06_STL TaxID=2842127 RepID=UPI001C5B57FA|nr:hypothetical protein [Janthinobacterium sp. NKUCC06_STL]MBW3512039.1 hypothetical protein [Janthinobacterium sp. NKUCC06_STL]